MCATLKDERWTWRTEEQKKFTSRKTENEDNTASSLTIETETLTAGPPMSAYCFKSIYESWLLRHILTISHNRWGDRGLKKHLSPVHDQVASKLKLILRQIYVSRSIDNFLAHTSIGIWHYLIPLHNISLSLLFFFYKFSINFVSPNTANARKLIMTLVYL